MKILRTYLFIFITVYEYVIELEAVTVNPSLCPTNKIAPHRRASSGSPGEERTLRLFYDLLAPHRPYRDPLNDLQEQPQEDDPNDCGEIEDYDETDLSSVTNSNYAQRKKDRHNRMLFGYFPRPGSPPVNTPAPPRPQRPPPHTRPPFWSGGIFGSNVYRPPYPHRPSNFIKPVQEDSTDTHATYRPEVVGGPSGHVVGYTTTTRPRPTRRPRPTVTSQKPFRFPSESDSHTRVPRTRLLNPSTNIVGSFVDLLFN